MRLTSNPLSTHVTYRDCLRGVPRGGQNVQKLTHVPLAIAILLVITAIYYYFFYFLRYTILLK